MSSIKDTRQLVIFLDRSGRAISKQTLSADRREVTGQWPEGAVRVLTTPLGWNTARQTGRNAPLKAGYSRDRRIRQSGGRQKNIDSRQSSTYKYRPPVQNDFNYFGAYYRIHLYSDGCGSYRVGEELEQSYFKPRSTGPKSGFGRLVAGQPTENRGPYHDILDAAVEPKISSLKFTGTGDNTTGHTGGILRIDYHKSFGFTTGYHAGVSTARNFQYLHADFWIKPDKPFKAGSVIFGKGKQLGAGASGAMEFALKTYGLGSDARPLGLQWAWTQTNAGNTASISNTFNMTGLTAQKVVGGTGGPELNGGTGAWHHIQVERAYNQFRFFINGRLEYIQAIGTGDGIYGDEGDFILGGHRDGKHALNAHFDQFHYRLGAVGATTGSMGTIGRGYLNGGFTSNAAYAITDKAVGFTVGVPTTGCEELRDPYTKIMMPFDGIHRCTRVVERGNHRVSGVVVGWDYKNHDLYVDNVGWTGSLCAGTGDQGEEYFSRDYGWIYGERGNQVYVQGLPDFINPSDPASTLTYTATPPANTGNAATPSPSGSQEQDGLWSPSISPTPSADGITHDVVSPSPTITTTGIDWSPHVSPHETAKEPHGTPEPSFTCTPSNSPSPSVSPTVSVSPTTTAGDPTSTASTPTPSASDPIGSPPFTPSTSIAISSSGPWSSPSASPTPTTSIGTSIEPTYHVIFSPTPSPSGTTGDFGSPHPDFHAHVHPNVTGSPTQSPTAHVTGSPFSPCPSVSLTNSPIPTIHTTISGTSGGKGTVSPCPSPHHSVAWSPTQHWIPTNSPASTMSPSITNTNIPHPTSHQANSPSPHGLHCPSPFPSPSVTRPGDDEAQTGSLATYEICEITQLLTTAEARNIAKETAANEAAVNMNAIIQGTIGENGELKHLFENTAGVSSAAGSDAPGTTPDGSGTRTFGGVANPDTGTTSTHHFLAIRPTNDLMARLNAIVTAGQLGSQESFYCIPNAFGVEYLMTYHDCRLLFMDLVNYRYKVENAFTTTIGNINRSTELAGIRTVETKNIPLVKSGAFVAGRYTSYEKTITTSASSNLQTGFELLADYATASTKQGSKSYSQQFTLGFGV